MKREWLKVLMLLMMGGASFGSPMNPKEIEELMYIMNQTRIEFTVPNGGRLEFPPLVYQIPFAGVFSVQAELRR